MHFSERTPDLVAKNGTRPEFAIIQNFPCSNNPDNPKIVGDKYQILLVS